MNPSSLDRRALLISLVLGIWAAVSIEFFGPATCAASLAAIAGVAILFVNPGLFFFIAVAVYSSIQAFLQGSLEITIGTLELNASKIYITVLSAMLVVRLIASMAVGERVPRPLPVHAIHLLFVIYALIGLVTARESGEAISIVFRIGMCCAIHYLSYWLTPRYSRWIDYAVLSALFAAALSTLSERFLATDLLRVISVGAQRAEGSFGGPVSTGTIAFAAMPAIAKLLTLGTTRWDRRLGIAGVGALAITLVMTLTRSAIVGVLLFGIFTALFGHGASALDRRRRFVLVLLLAIGLFGGIALLPDQYIEARTRDIPGLSNEHGLDPNAGSGRVMIWKTTLLLWQESDLVEMFFGHGLSSALGDLYQILRITVGVHNSYLCALYELGVCGLLLMLIETVVCYRSLHQRPHHDRRARVLLSLYRCYFAAYLLSTLMFNDYYFALGAKWFTYLGLGQVLALTRLAAPAAVQQPLPDAVRAAVPASG